MSMQGGERLDSGLLTEKTLRDLPCPRGLPLIGNLHQVRFDRLHLQLEAWAERYGDMFVVRYGPIRGLVISDREAVQRMLIDRPDSFRRPSMIELTASDMRLKGVFAAEGEDWRRQRRIVRRAQHRHARSFHGFQQAVESLLARIIDHRPARAFQGEEAARFLSGRRVRRTGEAPMAGIAAGALRDLRCHPPHILYRVGVDAVDALAARLALAPVYRAPARLQGDIAAIAGRSNDGAAHLAADGGRQHPRRHGSRRA